MPFNIPWLSDSLKKRALRYLLQRYLGHFLLEKLTLEQLSVDLYDGKGCIRDLALDVEGLNEELLFLPFKFVDGCRINQINCSVPWSALLAEECSLEIDGAMLFCQVTGKAATEKTLGESSYLSKSMMSSSMQMAEEIVQNNDEPEDGKFDGLEVMAQVIDSVLRRVKFIATNTSFTIKGKDVSKILNISQATTQVEFKIKYLRCEEDNVPGEKEDQANSNQDRGLNGATSGSGCIDKLLTFEGVEVLIDNRVVCKLGGRHMIKIKASEARSDLQLFVGSPVLAIITSDELKRFIDVFCPSPEKPTHSLAGEKMMSSQDFARVEQQLQFDANHGFLPTVSHSIARGPNTWGCGGSTNCDSEAKFLPLNDILEDETSYPSLDNHFSCFIKIPGIWLCLLDRHGDTPEVSVPIVNSSFASINSYLDSMLGTRNHLRVLALPIQMDITYSNISIVAGDAMISEKTHRGLTPVPVFWSNDDNQVLNAPKYRCEIRGNAVTIEGDTTTCVTLDPTFLERMDSYFLPSDQHSNSSNPLSFQFSLKQVKATLLFPIPDLRTEAQRVEEEGVQGLNPNSDLRKECILINAEDLSVKTNLRQSEATCDSFKAFLLEPNSTPVLFAEAQRNSVESIEVNISVGPCAVVSSNFDNVLDRAAFLEGAEMEDSIFISNSNSHQTVEAFQVKRKVIKDRGNDNEPVIGPSDRENANSFLDQARAITKLQVEIKIPTGDVFLDKKQLDLVYNRFGNDIVLWKPKKSKASLEKDSQPIRKSSQPTYYTCKSGLADSEDSDSSFHSFDGGVSSKMQNYATCTVSIQELKFNALVEEDETQVVESQNVLLGIVLGLENQTSNVICICGDNVSLASNREKIVVNNGYTNSISSLSLTFDIRLERENLKRIKFALELSHAALMKTEIDVFKKFWGVINVTDEIVLGYNPPQVLTELHISLIDCAIVLENPYTRPAIFTFDDAYITSMVVVEKPSQTIFRFIVEEGSLYFSKGKKGARSLKDYICILDSGMTDLNLKIREDRTEFRISNNVINVRVCSDSLNALCELITHMATPNASAASPDQIYPEMTSPGPDSDADSNLIQDAIDYAPDDEDSHSEASGSTKSCDCEPKVDESGFWILGDDDVGAGIKPTAEPQIRVLVEEPVMLLENHFGVTKSRPLPEILPETRERYLLEELSIIFHFFGGRDFDDEEKETEKDYDKEFEAKLEREYGGEHRVRFAEDGTVHLWESLDLMSAPSAFRAGPSAASGNSKLQGGRFRQNDVCVQLYLAKAKSLFEKFDPTFAVSWRFVLMINEIEIRDKVSSSKINKMLYEYCSETMPRRNNANMISIKVASHRSVSDNNEECDIKISVKPLRINLDQDTVMFLIDYFAAVNPKGGFAQSPVSERRSSTASTTNMSEAQFFSAASDVMEKVEEENEEVKPVTKVDDAGGDNVSIASSSKPPSIYVKSFVFAPDVPIRLDYHGKRVDFEQGAIPGILMGLAQLNQSELRLKRLCNKHGILGLDRVALYAAGEWARDIKRYQLPSLLGGVGPMHSFIQLFQGVRDLVWMPIDQYRKDRRIVRGFQRGASSFSSSTAMAAIDLTNRFVNIIQHTAQFAHDVVSPATHNRLHHASGSLPSSQPRDIKEGMTTAYTMIREGVNDTVRTVTNASSQADDMSGAIGIVIRQIPSTILRPLIGVSQATSNVLVGARNQIAPEARKDDIDKFKKATN